MSEYASMRFFSHLAILLLGTLLASHNAFCEDEAASKARLAELDAYWAEVSRSVKEGDFDAYKATCHPEAVLVSGSKKTSYPLSKALERWKVEFDDTKAGDRESSVVFRFSHRFGDGSTAHEAGVFLYSFKLPGEPLKKEYIKFEALLVKKPDGWKILMEYQMEPVTAAEWDALK